MDAPVKYHAIPSSEEQTDHSDHDTGLVHNEDDLYYPTGEWFPAQAQVQWTYFLLGCAILLPWNGDSFLQTAPLLLALMSPLSPH